ncbi:MAG: imidazoleglycerol-phosphate dehydratase HisB [Oscillospiraceae bacterium]|nr:imidazoleglycerol-phosphate dehydratase HisB [Oscillospiraceae bacterium]MBQ8338744.1 imidazoleglycerol-phosphate dehydratase HisB [Oscillospiraceae bacterium]
MRVAEINRKTAETDIKLKLNIDGKGTSFIDSGCGFLDHMLTLFAKHGRFDLEVLCKGDTQVDDHHTVEDIGICLGMAFKEALGDKKGICRYGSAAIPMDETLILAAIDFSGREYLGFDEKIPAEQIGTFDTELNEEFWLAFVRNSACTLHLKQLAGSNSHHIIEGSFKAAARAIRAACAIEEGFENDIPSTKGVL